jgi:hypothetical protein
MMQDATSWYFAHLLALPPAEAAAEACAFLQQHGELGPAHGHLWPPGLSPSELCATIMRRGAQSMAQLACAPSLAGLRAAQAQAHLALQQHAHALPAHYM